jgi:hypothetical protein
VPKALRTWTASPQTAAFEIFVVGRVGLGLTEHGATGF